MKRKFIEQILWKKYKAWYDSIEDESVRQIVRNNVIITGGCIASMYLKEKINDFDFYFKTKEAVIKVVEYYIKKYEENNNITESNIGYITQESEEYQEYITNKSSWDVSSYRFMNIDKDRVKIITEEILFQRGNIKDKKFQPIYFSSNAITLTNKVQLIVRFHGEPTEIHENYDFEHCKSYWCSQDKKLVTTSSILECILAREIVYTGSKYPLCSIFRAKKFILRGWNCNAGQYLKMALQVSELDLYNIQTLEDQLIGVDSLYFHNLLSKIKEALDNKKEVTQNFIYDEINKIF